MSRYLYLAPLVDFLAAVDGGTLVEQLRARHQDLSDVPLNAAEVESWRHSLPALASALRDPCFARGEIFVELFMPLNGRRCDALLTGHGPVGPSAVLVELKGWSFVDRSHLPEHVWAGGRNVVHPSVQVRDYVETLRHFHSAFTGPDETIALGGAAYLHALPMKADRAKLRDATVFGHLPVDFPVFYEHEMRLFCRWMADRLVPGPGKIAADRIRSGHLLPSPKLLDLVVRCIRENKGWQLLDDQKTAYWAIRQAAQVARDTGHKRVIIVRGGPGTGKSVLALQLLADAAVQHWAVVHATGSKAFQTVLQAQTEAFALDMMKQIHGVKTKKALPVGSLFTTFAEVARLGSREPDRLDLTVCDEAHRLWQHRRQKFPNGTVRWLSDSEMADEVIAASKVTAFFLDDDQSVRAGEIGRAGHIIERAKALGVPWEEYSLDAQFRCAGSTSYVRWVDGLLGMRADLDLEWRRDHAYELRIWDRMPALDQHLRALRDQGRRCRLLAGFCWRWSKLDGRGVQPEDLTDPRFGGWRGAWINKTGLDRKPLEHQYYHWATDEDAYEQVGSIYSAQGFEFDDIGVIWGEDLVWRTDRWVADLARNKDGTFKKDVRTSGASPEEKLRNVYRVLLTRGMRSTHLFILDDETRAHVAACLAAEAVWLRRAVGAPAEVLGAPRLKVERGGGELTPPRSFRPRAVEPSAESPWRLAVPVLEWSAAAGGFSREWRDLIDPGWSEEWITWEGAPDFNPGDFVARVVGDSMEPQIRDGDWCLFEPAPIEQAVGRPALVRLWSDAPDGGSFTVKDVHVEWAPAQDGRMVRVAIELRSRNPRHPPLRFEVGDQSRVTVLAIVRRVLGQRIGP